ncbi:hypothetical protein Pmani_018677 [Petrolisthes manimaculis]|uniref:Uncharacterized protein n=1 Tax=Petrolisthes manimaculis TaxID=1843537 RepID=A0AAE1U8I6_9EUCA|nr:hypothetical protein Pmani_018677 [Petrolisthes manimaculis]
MTTDSHNALTHAQEGEVSPTTVPTETGELQDEQPLPPPVPSPTSDPVPPPVLSFTSDPVPRPVPSFTSDPVPSPVPSFTTDPVPAPDTFDIPTRSTTRQSPPVQTQTKQQQQQQTRQRPDQLHRESVSTRLNPETPRSEDPISVRSVSHGEESDEHEDFFEDNYEDPYHGTWPVSVERSVILWLIVAFIIILTIIVLVLLAVVFRLRMAIECLVQKICCNKTPCCN